MPAQRRCLGAAYVPAALRRGLVTVYDGAVLHAGLGNAAERDRALLNVNFAAPAGYEGLRSPLGLVLNVGAFCGPSRRACDFSGVLQGPAAARFDRASRASQQEAPRLKLRAGRGRRAHVKTQGMDIKILLASVAVKFWIAQVIKKELEGGREDYHLVGHLQDSRRLQPMRLLQRLHLVARDLLCTLDPQLVLKKILSKMSPALLLVSCMGVERFLSLFRTSPAWRMRISVLLEQWPVPDDVGPARLYGGAMDHPLVEDAVLGSIFEAAGQTSGRRFAVKVTHRQALEEARRAASEAFCEVPLNEIRFAELMRGSRHVVEVEEWVESGDYVCVVSALAGGGDLFEALVARGRGYEEAHVKSLVQQDAPRILQDVPCILVRSATRYGSGPAAAAVPGSPMHGGRPVQADGPGEPPRRRRASAAAAEPRLGTLRPSARARHQKRSPARRNRRSCAEDRRPPWAAALA
ncbi:unnamed protein product [Prorocentrum cordatum]|uniref:Non-specific serine/threonine protein kinase n=1 Tax=Prorocentrum cordatum TaxID=2364126 RepID=A0ABN9S1Y5_9DINO|nr:unnamed protein product [Polarella glacialis]